MFNSSKRKNRKKIKCKNKSNRELHDDTITKTKLSDKTGIIESLNETGDRISSLESDYNKGLSKELQRLVLISNQLRKDERQRAEFYNDKFWEECRRKPDKKKLLHNILLFVCGREGNGRKNASFYRQALEVLICDKVPNHKISDEIIKRGGLRAIVDDERQKNSERNLKKHSVNANDNDEMEKKDEFINDDKAEDDDVKDIKTSKKSSTKSSSNTGSTRNAVVEKVKSYSKGIFIDASSKQMDEILEADEGTKLRFTVKVQSPEKNGFVNLKLNKYQFL